MGKGWLVRLPADLEGRVAWRAPGDGERIGRRDSLAHVATLAGKRVTVVVPGVEVLLTRVLPPRVARRDLEKALPYLLEESLSSPVETLHFALGRRGADGWLPVAVVSRRLMEEWLETLGAAGLQPAAMIPEPLLLPWEATRWSVVVTDTVAMARTGEMAGFAVDLGNLPLALRLALADPRQSPPTRIRLLDHSASGRLPDLTELGLPVQTEPLGQDPLALLANPEASSPGINLLQGHFAPVGRWSGLMRALRVPLALLVIWLGIKGVAAWMSARDLEQRNAALEQAIQTVFRQTFPEVHRIVNPRVQMAQQLEALRRQTGQGSGEQGFLPLFARTTEVLKKNPAAVLQGVRFQEGKLELLLRLPDLQRLDALQQQLTRSGLTLSIHSAVREGDAIAARMKVEKP